MSAPDIRIVRWIVYLGLLLYGIRVVVGVMQGECVLGSWRWRC